MSCRHDLANGTCTRCYPGNPFGRSDGERVDPGPEEGYGANLEGPGAVVEVEAIDATQSERRDLDQATRRLLLISSRVLGGLGLGSDSRLAGWGHLAGWGYTISAGLASLDLGSDGMPSELVMSELRDMQRKSVSCSTIGGFVLGASLSAALGELLEICQAKREVPRAT